jgi:hypothetical protein
MDSQNIVRINWLAQQASKLAVHTFNGKGNRLGPSQTLFSNEIAIACRPHAEDGLMTTLHG